MNNAVRVIRILKWACFPLGYSMYYVTRSSFGLYIAIALSVAAIVGFWYLMRQEELRLTARDIAYEIRDVIMTRYGFEHLIEIKRMKSNVIVRIYVIRAGEKLQELKTAVMRRLTEQGYRDRIIALQVADMNSKEELGAHQKRMNLQLVELLSRQNTRRQHHGEG